MVQDEIAASVCLSVSCAAACLRRLSDRSNRWRKPSFTEGAAMVGATFDWLADVIESIDIDCLRYWVFATGTS